MLGRVRLPAVPRRLRSYWALRHLAFFGRRFGRPLLHGPPRLGAASVPAVGAPSTFGVSEILAQAPRWPGFARGRARLSQVPGSSSCRVPWSATPPSAPPSCPCVATTTLLPSGDSSPWALGNQQFRGCAHTAHVLAHLRIIPGHRCPRSKARYRPAGLGSCRTGFAPAGRLLEIS